jgi:hypothetical protein
MNTAVNSAATALLLAVVTLGTVANAQVLTPEQGGSGGLHFARDCKKPGEYLIGFNASAGKALNAIQPICMPQKSGMWDGSEYANGNFGGLNAQIIGGGVFGAFGVENQPRCKRDHFVTAIHVYWDPMGAVHHIKIFCHNASRSQESVVETNTQGGEPNHDASSPCPKTLFAIGVSGGAGDLITRLGLKCIGLSDHG